jgi:hypothetical protein
MVLTTLVLMIGGGLGDTAESTNTYGPVGNIYLTEDITNDVAAEYKKMTSDNFCGLLMSGNLGSTLNL